ncbi:unnamed protein product [Adineta steineri]|uniref:Rho-GAP domain-containing protein n=1 Tax=Adineta steineri TaxID=433720 RepID=A0A815DLS1_9BILA|nr:unnamed protein product [Adineta steineri]
MNDPNPDLNRFVEIRNLIQKIPKPNRDTIRLLFLHLHDIIHQTNTMSPSQTPSSKNNESSFIPVTIATLIKNKERIVKYLIQHATDIFDRPRTSSASRVTLIKNVSRSSLHSETIEELEAELNKQEALLNKMHEEMQQSQPVSSTYGTTTPTNVDKDKEEQLWAQQRLVTALKRKIKQETRRLQQNRLSSFLEHSGSTTAQLIPAEQSTGIFKIMNDPNPDLNRFVEIRNLIQKIPKPNRDTIRLLFLHLHDIIHQTNTMSPSQTPSSKNNESSFIPVTIATLIKNKERIVKYLIQHATDIFDRPRTSSASRVTLIKNVSRSSLHSETIEELEAELNKQEALLNKMHEEMQQSQPVSSTYGTTTPTNVDKDKEEQLWAQQRLVTALKRKIKQETRRLQQNRLSSFLEHSGSTTAVSLNKKENNTKRILE